MSHCLPSKYESHKVKMVNDRNCLSPNIEEFLLSAFVLVSGIKYLRIPTI